MNRTLALFLTLAILLAHTLAIHKSATGLIAPPYDEAHVAYRMGRNLLETGSMAWDQGSPAVESYPSLLWVLVAWAGERFNFGVTVFCQAVGAASVVITIFVLAQFSPVRLAGVIAPLLFVVSGGIAAAAASGAETASFALFVAVSFLAYERRSKWAFAIGLSLCVVTRAEGVGFALMLLVLEIAATLRHLRTPRINLLPWFAPAAVVVVLLGFVRHHVFGAWLSPFAPAWLELDPERWRVGARYLADFMRATGWTILLVFPLYYLVRGTLTGVGRRALLLSLGYAAMVAGMGGGHGPMFQPLVPMFALLLIAIQEAMTLALDSSRRVWPQVTWAFFLLALATSALGSKYPGDLGLLPLESVHRAWMQGSTPARLSYAEPLGRMGLDEEIDVTERLRALGVFMRRQLDPRDTVLTPWPGAIGYLSRLRVIDALGRATLLPGESQPRPWSGLQRADIVAVLAQAPDYVVPAINWSLQPPTLQELNKSWAEAMDGEPGDHSPDRFGATEEPLDRGADEARRRAARGLAIRNELNAYELITVPVPLRNSAHPNAATRPFHLLRRRALDLSPRLSISVDRGQFQVSVQHSSHQQLVDLRVMLLDSRSRLWSLQPTGTPREGIGGSMRTSILLFDTGDRAIELASGELPPDIEVVELRAVLRNPLARGEHPYANASELVRFQVGQ